jgi:hypothetical protein
MGSSADRLIRWFGDLAFRALDRKIPARIIERKI